jgi:hypothetical protein
MKQCAKAEGSALSRGPVEATIGGLD